MNPGFSDGIRPKCQVFPMRSLYEPDRWMNHPKGQDPKSCLKALFPSTQKVPPKRSRSEKLSESSFSIHPKGQHIQNGCKSEVVHLPKGQYPAKIPKNLCLYHLKGQHVFKRDETGIWPIHPKGQHLVACTCQKPPNQQGLTTQHTII